MSGACRNTKYSQAATMQVYRDSDKPEQGNQGNTPAGGYCCVAGSLSHVIGVGSAHAPTLHRMTAGRYLSRYFQEVNPFN